MTGFDQRPTRVRQHSRQEMRSLTRMRNTVVLGPESVTIWARQSDHPPRARALWPPRMESASTSIGNRIFFFKVSLLMQGKKKDMNDDFFISRSLGLTVGSHFLFLPRIFKTCPRSRSTVQQRILTPCWLSILLSAKTRSLLKAPDLR